MKVDNILKWLPLGSIIAIIFTGGVLYATIKSLIFDNAEQKVNVIKHEKSAPNDVDTYILYQQLDSMSKAEIKNKTDAIRSRADRDSLMKVTVEISNRNAVTVYQMKETIDSIQTYWKKYNAEN